MRINLTPKERFTILKRDGFACQYCGARAPNARLFVDHVVPVVDGGSNDPENLVAACFECNAGKGTDRVPLFEAQRKVWSLVKALPSATYSEEWRRGHTHQIVGTMERAGLDRQVIEAAQLSVKTWDEWRQYCDDLMAESAAHIASQPYFDGYLRFCRPDLDAEHTRRFRPWLSQPNGEVN